MPSKHPMSITFLTNIKAFERFPQFLSPMNHFLQPISNVLQGMSFLLFKTVRCSILYFGWKLMHNGCIFFLLYKKSGLFVV